MKKKQFQRELARFIVYYAMDVPDYQQVLYDLRKKCTKRQRKRLLKTMIEVSNLRTSLLFSPANISWVAQRCGVTKKG